LLAFSATLVNPVVMRAPSLCRAHVALPRDVPLAASPCTRLSRAPSTIDESDSHCRLCLSLDVPRSSLPTRVRGGTAVGLPGSCRLPCCRAVLLDPAGVSCVHGLYRTYTVAFQIIDPVGLRILFARGS